jgi:archaellum biogenesis protein FlaJ (TadC family)
MLDWVYNNETLLWWLFLFSIVSFVVTLVTVPIVLIRLPEDYFFFPERHPIYSKHQNRMLRIIIIMIKNVAGTIFILIGIALLVLPGQGLLTILIGLALLDFPGKYKLERWLISRPAVLQSINWIRVKAGKAQLLDKPVK